MNQWNEEIEDFDICFGTLRQKYIKNQNFEVVPDPITAKYKDGQFRRIVSRSGPIILRGKDGGIFGYRVPAILVSEDGSHIEGLLKWVAEFGPSLPEQKDEKRNIKCVRRYGHWVKYNKGGDLKETGDYRKDGLVAKKFFEYTSLFWNCIRESFPQHCLGRVFRDLTQYDLNLGQKRMCGLWTVCAINVAVNGNPVETTPHRDLQGFFRGMSCLCPFGNFVGGDLILWELEAVVELKSGDLFFFTDHLINHSNETADGQRNSVVAFTEDKTWSWMQKMYGFLDHRVAPARQAQKRFREKGKQIQKQKKHS
jgi:hypothetical protein